MSIVRAVFYPLSVLLLILMCGTSGLQAEPSALQLNVNAFDRELIGRHLEFLEDPDGSLDIAGAQSAAAAGRFQPVEEDIFQPGIWSNSVWWLRLSVANETEDSVDWLLELENRFIDSALLFYLREQGQMARHEVGHRMPFADRPVNFRNYVFPLTTPPGPQVFYLRLETSGNKKFPLRVHSPADFKEFRQRDLMVNSLFLGALAILLIYNLFLLVTVRDIGYLYVSTIILVSGLGFLWVPGIGFQFLWPDTPALNKHLILLLPLSLPMFVPYVRRILETRIRVPRLDLVLRIFFWVMIGFVCLYPILPYTLFVRVGLAILMPAFMFFLLMISLVGIFALGTAYPAGRYYLTGVALFGLSLNLLFQVLLNGFNESFAAQAVAKVAFGLFLAFLSISILFKVRFVRETLQALNAARAVAVAETPESSDPEADAADSSGWTITPRMERKLQLALSYLRENYREEISREGLAAELDLNPDNLGRLFKMYTGDKIGDYVNKQRVQAAAWRLRDADRKIADIAVEVGFENVSTFNRVFKNIMKTTPSRFRNMTAPPEQLRNF